MPHIQLEYSENCQHKTGFSNLFEQIHQTLHSTAGIQLSNCKSRAICHQEYYIADGDASHAFVHLSIRFVEGRTDALKGTVGAACLEILRSFFNSQIKSLNLQVTVEIRDIALKEYHKYPEGTLTKQS